MGNVVQIKSNSTQATRAIDAILAVSDCSLLRLGSGATVGDLTGSGTLELESGWTGTVGTIASTIVVIDERAGGALTTYVKAVPTDVAYTATGITVSPGFQFKKLGKQVFLNGSFTKTAAMAVGTQTTVLNTGSDTTVRPANSMYLPCVFGTGSFPKAEAILYVSNGGAIYLNCSSVTAMAAGDTVTFSVSWFAA
jgi:hypothetical protein